MKKQKSKKKSNKVAPEQRELAAKFIADTKNDLELAPQTPLGIQSQAEFSQPEFHKD